MKSSLRSFQCLITFNVSGDIRFIRTTWLYGMPSSMLLDVIYSARNYGDQLVFYR